MNERRPNPFLHRQEKPVSDIIGELLAPQEDKPEPAPEPELKPVVPGGETPTYPSEPDILSDPWWEDLLQAQLQMMRIYVMRRYGKRG